MFFSFLYILILVSLYGVIYWLPTVVKGFGVSGTVNGLLSALPWLLAAIMLLWLPGRLKQEKIVLTAILLVALLGLVCFAASILVQENWMRLVALTIGTPCISLLLPCFWSLPYRYFKGAEAATSIAAISTVGNLGGFLAQTLMPWVAQTSGSPIAAMMVPAICLAGLAFCAALMRRSPAAPATMTPRTV